MLKVGDPVLLIGIAHPNEVMFTLSRVVTMDKHFQEFVPEALNMLRAEMFLDWGDATIDEMLIVDQRLGVRQVNPADWLDI